MRDAPAEQAVSSSSDECTKGPATVPAPRGKVTPLIRFELPDLTLYSIDFLVPVLKPTGLSRRGILALLRALHVPTLAIGPYRLFDLDAFSLALKAVLRVGGGDFLAPSTWRARRTTPSGRWTKELDVEQFKKDLRYVMAEWLASRRRNLPQYKVLAEKTDLRRAQLFAERLIIFGLARTSEEAKELLASLANDETHMDGHRTLTEMTAAGSLLAEDKANA